VRDWDRRKRLRLRSQLPLLQEQAVDSALPSARYGQSDVENDRLRRTAQSAIPKYLGGGNPGELWHGCDVPRRVDGGIVFPAPAAFTRVTPSLALPA
jgi:hypothetical protein